MFRAWLYVNEHLVGKFGSIEKENCRNLYAKRNSEKKNYSNVD